MEPCPHQEHQDITDEAVKQVAADNQNNGQLYVFREKNMVKFPVGISYIHVQQGMEADNFPEKNIYQQPAKKTDGQPGLFPPHKSEGRSQHNEQVGDNPSEGQCMEYGTLQQKAGNNQYKHYKDSFHADAHAPFPKLQNPFSK